MFFTFVWYERLPNLFLDRIEDLSRHLQLEPNLNDLDRNCKLISLMPKGIHFLIFVFHPVFVSLFFQTPPYFHQQKTLHLKSLAQKQTKRREKKIQLSAMDLAFVLPTHGATVTVTAPTTAATASAAAPSATAAQQGVAALGVAAAAGAAMRRGRRSAKVPREQSGSSLEDSFLGGAFQYVSFLFTFILRKSSHFDEAFFY